MSDRFKEQQRKFLKSQRVVGALANASPTVPTAHRSFAPVQTADEVFLPLKEWAERLGGVSTRTIKRWSQAKYIPPIKYIRGRGVLPASALEDAIRRNLTDRPRQVPVRDRGESGRFVSGAAIGGR